MKQNTNSIAVPHQNSHRLSGGFVETNKKLLIHYILSPERLEELRKGENI